MKKICCVFLLVAVMGAASAELNPPHRYFEIGTDVSAGVSNNWFAVNDFFKDVLLVDLNKMSDELKDGMNLNAAADVNVFMNLNLGKVARIGTFVAVDGDGMVNLPQTLLDFIANGNAQTPNGFSGELYIGTAVYVEAGFSIQSFVKKFGIKVTPTVFMPALYVPDTEAAYSVSTKDDGHSSISASADISVYSAIPLDTRTLNVSEQLAGAGLDFDLEVEYPLLKNLDLGVALRHIPAVPASMIYKMGFTATAEYAMEPLLNGSSSGLKYDGTYTHTDPVYETLSSPYTVQRPIIFGVQAAYRPFGDWFVVKGNADCVFKNPVYLNAGVEAGIYFLPMSKMGGHLLAAAFSMNYEDSVWIQRVTIGLNLRVLELTAHVSSQSSDFIKSFTGTGLGAGLGVRIGF